MEAENAQAAIENLLDERRAFPPPDSFRAGAVVKDDSVYHEAEADF